jgi:HKD family nuclease
MMRKFIWQPDSKEPLGDYLIAHLRENEWVEFRAAIAFVKSSGVKHLYDPLRQFAERASAYISVGIDLRGTSFEGLQLLHQCVGKNGVIHIVHNENDSTFHPKVYIFKSKTAAQVVVGSGNLTEGGLYTNYEASVGLQLDLTVESDLQFIEELESCLESWSDEKSGIAVKLSDEVLQQLLSEGYIAREKDLLAGRKKAAAEGEKQKAEKEGIFKNVKTTKPPFIKIPPGIEIVETGKEGGEEEFVEVVWNQGFVMTLQQTDVGVGQTTRGAARRSPEIFVPLAARDYDPEFWGWPDSFSEDATRPGKFDRSGVSVRVGTVRAEVNMMTWPVKHDFRLRSEVLRSAGSVGDIMRIERATEKSGYDYYVEIIPVGTALYDEFLEKCINATRNSARRWGYY